MPSDESTWLVSVPQDGDSEGLLQELSTKLSQQSKLFSPNSIAQLVIPSFKVSLVLIFPFIRSFIVPPHTQTGTLDLLIALSEDLPKLEAFFTATVARTVDTLRNLLNNDPSRLSQHILVNEKKVDDYILKDWRWNEGRYGVHRDLREMIDVLNKVLPSRPSTLPH